MPAAVACSVKCRPHHRLSALQLPTALQLLPRGAPASAGERAMCRPPPLLRGSPKGAPCLCRSPVCRLMEGTSSKAIVILATGDCLGVALGNGDISWKDFLSRAAGRPSIYFPVYQFPDTLINIPFSSATTGEPKAIPWTQFSPIRCGADNWAHLDVRPKGHWPVA
ncbi:hypothetical protein ZWY2020_026646 [Hordeum vulgare]|nr:hypothetical protein ZWY2020_026646 [Hordeum vulgare]